MQSSSADTNYTFGDNVVAVAESEEINHHPQQVKRVELLVELGKTYLPDAAEAQQVADLRDVSSW